MEKQEPKKAWVTPELIVLVRSRPEEVVLTVCKQNFALGPILSVGGCLNFCAPQCSVISAS